MLHSSYFNDEAGVQISGVFMNRWMRNNAQNNKKKQVLKNVF